MRHKNSPATRHLLRSAAGFALSLGLMGGTAYGQVTVSDATTTPLDTAASGDITVDAAGSIDLTDNVGPAITVNSDNNAVLDGTITINSTGEGGVDNATAVLLEGGTDRSFTQTGAIAISDNFTPPTDTDEDILADGPFAAGTGRTGILISGASPFEGNLELQDGATIAIEGNDSFAINLENTPMTQGGLTGNLLSDANISLTGDDNAAFNIASNVTGDVNNTGDLSIVGPGSSAFNVTGDIDGGFINSGTILNTGFRSSARPATAEGLTGRDIFEAEDLQNANSAINIESNIARGIFLEQRVDIITADDGTETISTGTSSVQQFGAAPAIMIDGNGVPIAIGTVAAINNPADADFDATQQFAFINQGTVTAQGIFDDFDATALSVADATLAGGISNSGTLTSGTFVAPIDLEDTERGSGIARVIVLGDQAIADSINNTGSISAIASEATDVVFADLDNPVAARDVVAIAIDIGENATTNRLDNTNTIQSIITGRQGEAVAIRDSSGTLTELTNSGIISAIGINSDPTDGSVTDFDLVAIDVSSNTTGVTYTQSQSAATTATPSTNGDVLFGSGDDSFIASAGAINGDIDFAGGDDVFDISGGTDFTGNIANTDGLILSVRENSNVTFTEATPVNLTEATFDSTSSFSPIIDGTTGVNSSLNATGDITFEPGATITPVLTNVLGLSDAGEAEFTIATAGGTLTADDIEGLDTGLNPFLFATDISFLNGDESTNTLVVTLDLREADDPELWLDAAQQGVDGSTFNTVIENLQNATELGNAFSNITDSASFQAAYNQVLPEISGAARQFLVASVDGSTGAVGTHLDAARRSPEKPGGIWLETFAYFADRSLAGKSEQFRGDGFGFTGGVDTAFGPFHALGVNVGFSSTQVEDVVGQDDPLDITTIQGGAYAGLAFGNLGISAYAGGGYSDYEQDREVEVGDFFGTAQGDWDGTHINGSLRAGYDIELSEKFWIRPSASIDYLRLTENAYTETGTFGVALDVDKRTTETGSASGVINLGARFEGKRTWIKPSLRAGYKYDFINDPTVTNFRFAGGNDFLATQTAQLQSFLFPDQGLLLGFSIAAGSLFSSVSLDFDSDIRDGFVRHTGRVVFRLLF